MPDPVITLSLPQLALALLPVAMTVGILFYWSLNAGHALYALLRMLVQLLLIGYVLAWIFGTNQASLIVLVLLIMLLASSWIALNTVPEQRVRLLLVSLLAITVGGGLTLALITQMVLVLEPLVPAALHGAPGRDGVRKRHDLRQPRGRKASGRTRAWPGVGAGTGGGVPGGDDSRDQFAVCRGPGITAWHDDRADTVRCVPAGSVALPDHGDVHDIRVVRYLDRGFPVAVSRSAARLSSPWDALYPVGESCSPGQLLPEGRV